MKGYEGNYVKKTCYPDGRLLPDPRCRVSGDISIQAAVQRGSDRLNAGGVPAFAFVHDEFHEP